MDVLCRELVLVYIVIMQAYIRNKLISYKACLVPRTCKMLKQVTYMFLQIVLLQMR